MINPKAKKKFLSRKLENFDWMKKEKPETINTAIRQLLPRPRFGKVRLWVHQKVCFLLIIYFQRFMLFLDMGGGKTLITLMVIKYNKKRNKKFKAIIFVPYVITVDTWIEETEKWTNLKCIPLVGTGEENRDILKNTDGDLYVVSYQTAVANLSKKIYNPKKRKNQWSLPAAKVRQAFSDFDMLVMDEIHKCGNNESHYFRMCRAISKEVDWVIGLTGTPFGRNLEALWTQFYLVDLGKTLSETLGFYRDVFFTEKQSYWGGGYEYKFKKRMLPKLKSVLKNVSIRYKIQECHEMPPKQTIKKYVNIDDSVAGYYDTVIESLNNLKFGQTSYREVESQYTKLRQLTAGFLTAKGDDETKVEIEFPKNSKLDALEELAMSMPEDSKMIIFHDYVYSNVLISKRLKLLKIPHTRVYGKQKNVLNELRKFKKDPKYRVIVINDQSGSSSQNLQMADYVVFYDQPRSSINKEQAKRRAWRPGQKKKVKFFELLVRNSVDEQCYQMNKQGKDLLKEVLDGKSKLKTLRRK